MKQFRITSQDFRSDADTSMAPDAYCHNIEELKKLAGLTFGQKMLENYYAAGNSDPMHDVPMDAEGETHSPVGSLSMTAAEKKQKEKDDGIKPGTDEWFKLWFKDISGDSLMGIGRKRRE